MEEVDDLAAVVDSIRWLAKESFPALINLLHGEGYRVVAPTVSEGAIVYDEIVRAEQLPQGWTDQQEPGKYRLARRDDGRWFGFVVGPHSWKQFLFPATACVATAQRTLSGWSVEATPENPPKYAFLGVRACELAAIEVQDRVFCNQAYTDPVYAGRRNASVIIAVNCAQSAATCFCDSMGTGPRCSRGFDLCLTEGETGFVIETGSPKGRLLAERLPTRLANGDESALIDRTARTAAEQQVRKLDPRHLREDLLGNLEHPRWAEVAARCLSCANCTQVCPTCFCSSVREVTDLVGDHVERQRQWDSCFNPEFSYLNGGIVRHTIRSRYRQWLTHKLATWHDQFGTSGCVGCGRCITWCPVGIDLTEEVAAIRKETA